MNHQKVVCDTGYIPNKARYQVHNDGTIHKYTWLGVGKVEIYYFDNGELILEYAEFLDGNFFDEKTLIHSGLNRNCCVVFLIENGLMGE